MKKTVAFAFFLSCFCIASACEQPEKKVRFFKPNHGWAIEVPFSGFRILDSDQYKEKNFKVTAVNESRGIYFDIYFEPGARDHDSKKVRGFYEANLDRAGLSREKISRWETPSAAYLVYTARKVWKEPEGDELNGDMYLCKGSTWVDVRFTKPYPAEGDERTVTDLLRSVRVVGAFEPSAEDNVFMGNLFCYSGFGDNCLSCLGAAFESEKKTPSLSRELRIALCQNYGNALRMKNDRGKALEVLNYGLAHDPAYPMYFWIKARIFGDLGDEEGAVQMLQAAADNKKLLLPGEKFPDPRQDEAFKVLGMKSSFRMRVTKMFYPEEEGDKGGGESKEPPKTSK